MRRGRKLSSSVVILTPATVVRHGGRGLRRPSGVTIKLNDHTVQINAIRDQQKIKGGSGKESVYGSVFNDPKNNHFPSTL